MEKTACPSSYVVVDLETTGLYPSQDRILEIGAVKVLDGEVADTFCMFADPQMKIPEKIRELTGITQDSRHRQKQCVPFWISAGNWI